MADLVHAASSQVSYYDIAASAASLSYLASKAQAAPLSRDEWQQFMATTEQLRRAFSSLHGRRSPVADNGSPSSSFSSPSTYAPTTTSASASPSSVYSTSPLSSPSPSPVFFAHHLTNDEEVHQQVRTPCVERRRRSRGFKECAHCGTSESSQWRRGPFDKAKLCNACGLRYSRNFAKKRQQKGERERLVAEARECAPPTTAVPRSDIYDLLN